MTATMSGPGVALTTPALPNDLEGVAEMAKGTCSIDGCGKPARNRGWCSMHYERWRLHGDPGVNLTPSWPENLTTRMTPQESGCIHFDGASPGRYGQIHRGSDVVGAHVASYELFVGPVPSGCHLHHKCENRQCVNSDHLVPLTPREHSLAHAKTHCKWGHEFTPDNTYVYQGKRHCKECGRERTRARRRAT